MLMFLGLTVWLIHVAVSLLKVGSKSLPPSTRTHGFSFSLPQSVQAPIDLNGVNYKKGQMHYRWGRLGKGFVYTFFFQSIESVKLNFLN